MTPSTENLDQIVGCSYARLNIAASKRDVETRSVLVQLSSDSSKGHKHDVVQNALIW